MTIKNILSKLDRIISDAEAEAMESLIDGYGYASFPIRLSQKQANMIEAYLSDRGFIYWICDEVRINESATYELWVSIQASMMSDISPDAYWGFRRITTSPYDEIYESVTRAGRRVRVR